ncbi:hypothetical protein [Vreelandella alkaliphila]|uniref:NTP pyrophosphohydrolase MazG putative catalytic core domain-containing protein n=1 Tax=Vreelandella alkaliphila TaxID=272774 RepID=A0AAJ2VSE7_9GAMM|nr:hypothetical protein [Halomonas alkaliphila]MDX5979574.1 hypothetical protein [Halomonas alkaliphila]
MKAIEYTPLAMTTASPSAGDHGVSSDLVHAVLGLCDEAKELLDAKTAENVIEELGDLLWFCALADSTLKLQLFERHAVEQTEGTTPFDIAAAALTLSGLIKKPYAYGKSLPLTKITHELLVIVAAVETLADRLNMTLAEVMELNLLKLKMRFPDRFNCAAAISRNAAHELALFEHWQTVLPIIRKSSVWFLCQESDLNDAKAYLGAHHAGQADTKFLKPTNVNRPGYWLAYALPSPKKARK